MPAEKSKNSLPSTSVTTMPRPLFATSGYDLVYDGDMYFWSPSSTRLALGPGRAVLIFGPIAVMVLVVMASSAAAVSSRPPVVGRCNPGMRNSGSSRRRTKANQAEDGINRYRTGWDATAKAGSPDSAADTPGSAASTRPAVTVQDANWDSCAASQSID